MTDRCVHSASQLFIILELKNCPGLRIKDRTTVLPSSLTLTLEPDFQSLACYGSDPYTHAKKLRSHVRKFKSRVVTNGQTNVPMDTTEFTTLININVKVKR